MNVAVGRMLRVGVIALLSASLSGCISIIEREAPVPRDGTLIVVTPGGPGKLLLSNHADATSYIPLYGLAKQMQTMEAEPRINAEMAAQGFKVEEELQLALVRDIRPRGINVGTASVERVPRLLPRALKRTELPPADGSWAMIDARITGYGVQAEISGELRPFLGVIARMIDPRSGKVLYEKRFAYNHWGGKVVRIPFEPADQWPSVAAVESDVPGVIAAIRRGISKITELIAADIGAT